jgi:DNA replication protein DnaC
MKDSNFDKLNELDKLIYTTQTEICASCQGIDKCKQDLVGIIPIITRSYTTAEWGLSGIECGKQRGKWYSHLDITKYNDIYKNPKRDDIVDYLLKGKGAFIFGDGGNGKTYTLGYIANEFNKKGKSIYFDLANNISNAVKNFDIKDKVLNDIYNVDIFILDDFGGEQLTQFIIYNVWIPILKNRIDNGKITYISSNYPIEKLYDTIQTATDTITATILLDRVSTLGVVNFKDKNYRMEDNNE